MCDLAIKAFRRFAAVLATLFFAAGCASPSERVLYDFAGASPSGGIEALPGAAIHQSGGRLFIRNPGGETGVRIRVPPWTNCVAFEDVLIPDMPQGGFIRWKWFVVDEDGIVFDILESEWTETASTRFITTKKDARGRRVQVRVVISDATVARYRPFRVAFDRRKVGGRDQIQLEFRHQRTNRIKKLFPWADPPGTFNVAFEIVTNLPNFSIGAVSGSAVHRESNLEEIPDEEFREIPAE